MGFISLLLPKWLLKVFGICRWKPWVSKGRIYYYCSSGRSRVISPLHNDFINSVVSKRGEKKPGLVSAVFAQAGICLQTSSEMFVLLFIWLVAARVVTSWFASSTQNYWASTDWSALASTHIPHIYEVFPLFTSHQPQICPSLFLQTLKKLLSRAPWGQVPVH